MQHRITTTVVIAIALLLSANLSAAVDNKAGVAVETKAVGKTKAPEKNTTTKAAKASAKAKLVDINSASKAELTKLPGINDALADNIIAGRPFNTKARLVTNKIISTEAYANIKQLIIAKQK